MTGALAGRASGPPVRRAAANRIEGPASEPNRIEGPASEPKSIGLATGPPGARRRAVLAPATVLFAIMVAHALLETARDALFLARLGPQLLASAYLAIAVVALLAVAAVRKWGNVRDPRRMLLMFLTGAAIGTAVLASVISGQRSAVFVLYVWTGLVATVVVPTFWTLVDRSLRVAEAKRVFAAIGAGGVSGAMVGSALAGALGRVTDAHHLVTAAAIAFALGTITVFLLAPRPLGPEPPPLVRNRSEGVSRHSRRYMRLLVIIGIISTVTVTLADLTFKRVLAERLDPGDLVTALGAIYTALNLVGLGIQLSVTRRLLAHWGVGGALMVLPILLVATAMGFTFTGAMFAIIALKLADGGMRHSLHRVGSEILYLPVPAAVRDGWKTIADALGQRGGQAIAALLAFSLATIGAGSRVFGAVIAIIALGWLGATWIVRRAYLTQFRDTLKAGEIERDARVPALDNDSLELLTEALSSPEEVEALAALELLAHGGRMPALILYHPRTSVVRRALASLDGQLRPDIVRVLDHLLSHSDGKIRAAALAAASRTGCHREQLVRAIADRDADVRAAALVGLVEEHAHARVVSDGIAALIAGTSADRVALAHAIAYAPHERFRRLLYDLLATRDCLVMREVLRVLARAPSLADLDRLLGLLEDPHVRGEVRRVFIAAGSRGLDRLIAALDDPRTPLGVRRHLPRTISRFGTSVAVDALVGRLLREPDSTTEFKILRALGRMRVTEPRLPVDTATLHEYVRRSIRDGARYATFRDRLDTESNQTPSGQLIGELLAEQLSSALEYALRGLGIMNPRDDLRSVHAALVSDSESRRSAAWEVLESLIPTDLRVPLFTLVDARSADERRAGLGDLAPGPFASYEEFLGALLADPSESLRCVVAHHVAERHLVALRPDLTRLRPLVGPALVIHAFDQAIARLDA